MKFKYVDVTVPEFNQKYSSEGWFGRKVVALPAAICSGIVKTIYHLVKAILVGFIGRLGDSNYLRARLFYIVRDWQESLGWLATLLSDRYGQYHIQESRFHKSCYDCFLTKNIPQPDSPQQGNINMSYRQGHSSSKTLIRRTAVPLNTPLQKPPQNQLFDKQSVINKVKRDPSSFSNLNYNFKNDEDVVAAALDGCKTSEQAKKVINNANYDAKSSKRVALALVKIDPALLGQLNYDAQNDEDVVAAALDGCKTSEQAKKVIDHANYDAKNSKKVAFTLVKIDPALLRQLSYDIRNNEDVFVAALKGCTTAEQAKKVIICAFSNVMNSKKVALILMKIDPTQLGYFSYDVRNDEDVVLAALGSCRSSDEAKIVIAHTNYDAMNSVKVALALVRIEPTLMVYLEYNLRNNLNVVLLAIELSKEHTIHKIWNYIGIYAAFNEEVRAKVKEKYPNFFLEQKSQGFPSSNTQNTSSQASNATARKEWSEPDDLKGNASDDAKIVRGILKQNYGLRIDLTRDDVSANKAKIVLCQLLELDGKILDKDLKKAYQKVVLRIHPDKLKLTSGEVAFKILNAAYKQSEL